MALDPRIAGNPTLHPAMQYQRCAECYYVGTADEDWARSDIGCPSCGAFGSPTIFPGDFYSLHMFPKLQRLYAERDLVMEIAGAERPAFTEVITVFAVFITESIIFTTAELALQKQKMPRDDIDRTLDSLKGSQQLVVHLAKLCNTKSIPKLLKPQADLRNMWDKWECVRTLRNKIAHASIFSCSVEDAERAFEVAVAFPGVARFILNEVPGLGPSKPC